MRGCWDEEEGLRDGEPPTSRGLGTTEAKGGREGGKGRTGEEVKGSNDTYCIYHTLSILSLMDY